MNIPICYDPIRQAERLAADQDREMETLPKCVICERRIKDEVYVEHLDRCVCERCLDELENNVKMELYW